MAVHTPGVWGIDLGQCALKAVRLELKDNVVVATAFDHIEHPKILSQPDADPDQLTREALEQFLSRNSLRGDMVVISVPGQSGLARFVKLPPVEEKKIADIVRFEAKQQIPFPLEEVVWDFQKLSSGSLAGDFVETEIGLFAMKREMVNRALGQFKDVGVEVHIIQMAPLALCNFIAYDHLNRGAANDQPAEEDASGKKQCVVALDMGTDSSNLVITDGGKIIWQRPIPIGGNHFTRALTKDLKLTFAKAEHLKRNAAKSPELRKILASLKSVLNDFVGEVQRSLGYFTNTHRDAQIKYMVGLGNAFRLPGLKQFLQEKLQLDVRKLAKFEKLTGDAVTGAPTFAENIMSFGVAYGLGLQGLSQTRLHTNLLPHEVRLERLVRGKKPWAAAAAACLLVAIAGLAMAKGLEDRQVTGDGIDKAKKEAKSVLGLVGSNKSSFDSEEKRIETSTTNLVRLAAGTKERLNWQLLHEYVNFALPLANGERLAEKGDDGSTPYANYYIGRKVTVGDDKKDIVDTTGYAAKAFQKLEARRFPKLDQPLDKAKALEEDQFIKKYLIQVNIEGVMQLYSEDLHAYFRKIYKDTNLLFGMSQSEKNQIRDFADAKDQEAKDKTKLPKVGWVIEIRGYTYHYDQMKFVTYSLLENLRMPDYMRKDPKLEKQSDQVKAMDKAIREQIGYIFVYEQEVVLDPQPGQFKNIGVSRLRDLVKGLSDGAGGGGDKPGGGPAGSTPGGGRGGGPTEPGKGDPGEAKPDRDGWAPIGEIAAKVLGGGASSGAGGYGSFSGGGPRPGEGGKEPPKGSVDFKGSKPPAPPAGDKKDPAATVSNVMLQPRTEFIILLVWSEPLPVAGPGAPVVPPATPPGTTGTPPEQKK